MPDYQLKTQIYVFNLKKSDTLCSATTFFTVAASNTYIKPVKIENIGHLIVCRGEKGKDYIDATIAIKPQ